MSSGLKAPRKGRFVEPPPAPTGKVGLGLTLPDPALPIDEPVAPPAPGQEKARLKRIGRVPGGDIRLSVNISIELHTRLKLHAVRERTTIGQLLEAWILTLPEK